MKFRILVLFILAAVILCSCNINGGENTQPTPEHTHAFEDTYSNNETHHWYECECGEKDSLAEHVWNDGVVTIIPYVLCKRVFFTTFTLIPVMCFIV